MISGASLDGMKVRGPDGRRSTTVIVAAVLLATVVSVPSAASGPDEDRIGLSELTDRVIDYVERFHREMEGAVLSERYVQVLRKPCCIEPRTPGENPGLGWGQENTTKRSKGIVARRQLESEVLLIPVSGGMRIGYRDVFEVDGRPVATRTERLRQLFAQSSARSEVELGRIAAESARFNLGPLTRTTNLPTTPLLYLARSIRPKLHISSGGRERSESKELAVLEFREDGSPTLVADVSGVDLPARGWLLVDPSTGAIHELELRFGEGVRRVLRVWFREEPRMDVLVPERMWEWYERVRIPQEKWPVDLEALATYTDVRLFTVSTSEDTGEAVP